MKPRIKLADTKTADGGTLSLFEQDGDYSISFDGQELMHSRLNASEKLLGELGLARLKMQSSERVLVGGLGLGFTLQRVLSTIRKDSPNRSRGTPTRCNRLEPQPPFQTQRLLAQRR